MRLAGRVTLISGSASGMGRSEATIFAQEGAKVVVADRLEAEGRDVVDAIVKWVAILSGRETVEAEALLPAAVEA